MKTLTINCFLMASMLLVAPVYSADLGERRFMQFFQIRKQVDQSIQGITSFDAVPDFSNFEFRLKPVSVPSRKPGEFCYTISLSSGHVERRITLFFNIKNDGTPIERVRKFLESGKAQNDLVLRRVDIYSYNTRTKELIHLGGSSK